MGFYRQEKRVRALVPCELFSPIYIVRFDPLGELTAATSQPRNPPKSRIHLEHSTRRRAVNVP